MSHAAGDRGAGYRLLYRALFDPTPIDNVRTRARQKKERGSDAFRAEIKAPARSDAGAIARN